MPRPYSTGRRGGITVGGMNDKVVLNVGGERFTTRAITLKSVSHTRLDNLDCSHPSYDPVNNEYFFDRSPRVFSAILDYLRTGSLHFPHCYCGPFIQAELDFWGIDETAISSCCWRAFKAYDDERSTLKQLKQTFADQEKDEEEEEMDAGMLQRWKRTIWNFLDKPHSSKPAKVGKDTFFIFKL